MDSYGKLLLYYAIPYFTISMLIEILYMRWKGEKLAVMDSISSLGSGMSNIVKDTLGLSVAIISYPFLLKYVQVLHWETPPVWIYLFCFVYIDFTGYCVHRIEHVVNYFWNNHIIHHSSEEFNLACALRQPISGIIGFFTIFYFPMAIVGVPTMVIAIIAPVHLFMQFWYHTRYINRLGFLEYVIVTPSHHRVHHAMNDIYMDKNFGQIFIIWDKMFGTFQEELPEVKPVYGIRRPANTWNPFLINFQHLYLLFTDAWRTKSLKDKLRIWIMPTGWRPADVAEKYPVAYVKQVEQLEKFAPAYSTAFTAWSFAQMLLNLALLCFLFFRMGAISHTETLLYGAFILLSVFAFTAVMDKKAYGVAAEFLKALTGSAIIFVTGDWFGLNSLITNGSLGVVIYFAVSATVSAWFYLSEFRQESAATSDLRYS